MTEQAHTEPITLNYAGRSPGRFEHLCRSQPDVHVRRTGLRWWAFVTLALYGAALLIIYAPLAYTCFWSQSKTSGGEDAAAFLFEPWFWLVFALFILAQILLLVVPVRAAWNYEIKPRRLIVPLATTSALLGLLTAGACTCGFLLAFKDAFIEPAMLVGIGLLILVSWFVWWRVFKKYDRVSQDQAIDITQRALIRGSILELLVAVGCHIWVRQRGDCSAPIFTFAAICAGFAVMLCAFGPGVFYLLVARSRRMQPMSRRDSA